MPQTRMFRDRVVSMEQTFEGGEKHLELLKTLCREALPEFEYVGHSLDHERDLFVVELAAPDGRRKTIGWTRMVLFDAERIPGLSGDPASLLRSRIVQYLKAHAGRPEILVTFRHLEEGWVDTPEPRRERRRRRRGRGEGKAAAEKMAGRPRAAAAGSPRGVAPPGSARGAPPSGSPRGTATGSAPARERTGRPGRSAPPTGAAAPPPSSSNAPDANRGGPDRAEGDRGRRRFRRRRRRGRGTGGGGSPAPSTPA